MSIVAVRSVLQAKLDGMSPALDTAWENFKYEPITGTPYQAAFVMPATPENPTLGGDRYREKRIFQSSLFYPLDVGTGVAEARAELIKTTFKRGTSMISGTVTVRIDRTPDISAGRVDGDRWHIPVKIRWFAGII